MLINQSQSYILTNVTEISRIVFAKGSKQNHINFPCLLLFRFGSAPNFVPYRYLFAVQFLRVAALSWKHFSWCTFFHASTGKGTNYSIDRRSVCHYLQLHLKEHVSFTKGKLISKHLFGVSNSFKKTRKQIDLRYYSSFFTKKTFRN